MTVPKRTYPQCEEPDEGSSIYPMPRSLKVYFRSALLLSACNFAITLLFAALYDYYPSAILSGLIGVSSWCIIAWGSTALESWSGLRPLCLKTVLFTVFPPQDLTTAEVTMISVIGTAWSWIDSYFAENTERCEKRKERSSFWFTDQVAVIGGSARGWKICYFAIESFGFYCGHAVVRAFFELSSLVMLDEHVELFFKILMPLVTIGAISKLVAEIGDIAFTYRQCKLSSACFGATYQLITLWIWSSRQGNTYCHIYDDLVSAESEHLRVAPISVLLFVSSFPLYFQHDHCPLREDAKQLVDVTFRLIPQQTTATRRYKCDPKNPYTSFTEH